MAKWFVYLLECSDRSIYTGITNDLKARIKTHNSGKGAKYTRGRVPVKLKAFYPHASRSAASKVEYALKKLPAAKKKEFIKRFPQKQLLKL